MRTRTLAPALALATALSLSSTGLAVAQLPGDGKATNAENTSDSLRSNGDKADNRTLGSARGGSDNPGGRPSDHNGTANTLGKTDISGGEGGKPASPAPRP